MRLGVGSWELGVDRRALLASVALLIAAGDARAQSPGSPGTLRAAYIATNPAQAMTDPASGEVRGVVVDLTRELARRQAATVQLIAAASPQAVIDAVRDGQADIGFVAFNPERAGPVEFSRPYLLVQQTFMVRAASPIRSVAEIDRPNQRIAAVKGDSMALYLARTLKQAQLVELTESTPAAISRMLLVNAIDAFGANRQRLTDAQRTASGLRVLPDDLYGVEQTIIVSRGNAAALAGVNAFIDDVIRSGFLGAAIARSGVAGITVAPLAN